MPQCLTNTMEVLRYQKILEELFKAIKLILKFECKWSSFWLCLSPWNTTFTKAKAVLNIFESYNLIPGI